MLSQSEYSVLKKYLNIYKEDLNIEYIIDILILMKPNERRIKTNKINDNLIGLVLIKIEKIISKEEDLKNTYLLTETIKLFQLIWNNCGNEINQKN